MKRIATSVGFVLVLSLFSSAMAGTAPPRFLEFYPKCDYQTLGTVEVFAHTRFTPPINPGSAQTLNSVRYLSTVVTDEKREEMMADARQQLLSQATAAGAKGIAITDVKFVQTGNWKGMMDVTATLLGACPDKAFTDGDPVAYDKFGRRQGAVKRIVYTKKITLPSFTQHENSTELSDNTKVTLDEGVYGVQLGDSFEKVEATFGVPSFSFSVDENWTLVAYGRSHWFTFKDSKLVEVRYGDSLFGNELTNHIEFDDRFDFRIWQVLGVSKDQPLSLDTIHYVEKAGKALTLVSDSYLQNDQAFKSQKAKGFILQDKAIMEGFPTLEIPENTQMTALLEKYLSHSDSFELFSASMLPEERLGSTKSVNGRRYVLMSPTILVELEGSRVRKILINNDFLKDSDVEFSSWKLGDYYYGRAKSDVLSEVSKDAFVLNDVIEMDHSDYLVTLYLTSMNSEEHLYSAEVKIY